MEQHISYLLAHFGYFGIIMALIGGIVGLPVPDELFLTFIGYHIFKGEMAYIPALLSVWAGSAAGISISYLLGVKLGLPFLKKFGPKLHLTEDKIDTAKKLYDKYGPFLLFIGYFIPGVRHMTAYLAGINGYSFRKFSFFAYTGALIWTITFLTFGYLLGNQWKSIEMYMSKFSVILVMLMAFILLAVFVIKKRKTI
ncbi:DedA family protein [Fictibacillus sp. B-59209]|uniref:DedA family protein n=1 Tax=Fictibacillus sp. B-59209 TaxID=3024873 RepID=UPI002E24A2C6|nr:DedA family protein [Fictibacillus sp. B-59209]